MRLFAQYEGKKAINCPYFQYIAKRELSNSQNEFMMRKKECSAINNQHSSGGLNLEVIIMMTNINFSIDNTKNCQRSATKMIRVRSVLSIRSESREVCPSLAICLFLLEFSFQLVLEFVVELDHLPHPFQKSVSSCLLQKSKKRLETDNGHYWSVIGNSLFFCLSTTAASNSIQFRNNNSKRQQKWKSKYYFCCTRPAQGEIQIST